MAAGERARFESLPKLADLHDLRLAQRETRRARAAARRGSAFDPQLREGFPHRCLRDFEHLGKLALRQRLTSAKSPATIAFRRRSTALSVSDCGRSIGFKSHPTPELTGIPDVIFHS
jgi:hypothetical protein